MMDNIEIMWCQSNSSCWLKSEETHWVQNESTVWMGSSETTWVQNESKHISNPYSSLLFYPAGS
ncbi:MAG: hypothetical protein RLY40_1268 [Pseudomonadota bacterium]|jgi:hypothetical protein